MPIDLEPPELAASEQFCQLSAPMLDYLRGLVGLPRLATGPVGREADERLLDQARRRLLVPPTGPPRLSPGLAALVASAAAPRLILVGTQRTFGTELRLQVRVGRIAVLVDVLPDSGELWCTARPALDVAGYAAELLDLTGRADEPPGPAWSGRLPVGDLVTMRTLGPEPDRDAVAELAGRTGAPADLVLAAAAPVALTHLEVIHRHDPEAAGGPTRVESGELVWLDAGPHGLWTLQPDAAGRTVELARRAPREVVGALTALIDGPGGEPC
jgi:hypothetical protein